MRPSTRLSGGMGGSFVGISGAIIPNAMMPITTRKNLLLGRSESSLDV